MSDIITLLPDSVANQIAAGEVIQRPASAVKELLENSIDAKSTEIRITVKDAGRTLIQIIDNGTGMSETDARMCFERHATSKIKNADDLFKITTMGFRGEAMASIAGVAQVEMKTKRAEDELGALIEMEGSKLKSHSSCQCQKGTIISVKNLFFNVPARRNFLKSDSVELRHIIDEFQKAAIAHPEISLSLHHNNVNLFHLEKGTLRQRLVGIFGETYNQKLVPVQEDTSIVNVTGFIGKPEFARKTRGEQFFFVNQRFIKSPYLHHAVQNAYEQLLPKDAFPSYFIHMQIDPALIDVNIHPTKTEIKFEDERSVYTIIRAAVKQSLGKYNISPSLDFNQEMSISIPHHAPKEEILMNPPKIHVDPKYNPFEVEEKKRMSGGSSNPFSAKKEKREVSYFDTSTPFEKFISPAHHGLPFSEKPRGEEEFEFPKEGEQKTKSRAYQLHNSYIISQIKTGMVIIDQQAAHQRILFEFYLATAEKHKAASQQLLFPQTLEFSASDAALLNELHEELRSMGFDINGFGKNTFIIHGTPADIADRNVFELLEKLMEDYKSSQSAKTELASNKREIVARSMAKNLSIRSGDTLTSEEMNRMVDELFACKMPYVSPAGKPTLITIGIEELEKKFKK